MKNAPPDTIVKIVHDTVRVENAGMTQAARDNQQLYTEIKKGLADGWNEGGSSHAEYSSSITDVFVPIVFFVICGYVLIKNIEAKRALRLAMIEKGMDPVLANSRTDDSQHIFTSLRRGLVFSCIGVALIIGYFFDMSTIGKEGFLTFAFSVAGAGLGYVLYHMSVKPKNISK